MAFQEILRAEVSVDPREVWRHLGGAGAPRVLGPCSLERTVRAARRAVTPREVADRWLARRLRPAEHAVFVLAAVDAAADPDERRDPVQRHLDHAVASAALRQFAARLEARLRAAAVPCTLSRRWSPGILGWGLAAGQREVFRQLDPGVLGVRLHESGCMEPAHAWSMVWGIGWFQARSASECAACGDLDCPIRVESPARVEEGAA